MNNGKLYCDTKALKASLPKPEGVCPRCGGTGKSDLTIGEHLEKGRKASGISQRAVAEMVSLSKMTISRIESGKQNASFAKIKELCDLYKINIGDL